jgi:nucleoside-diphosphate-sugar epimerase
MQVLHASLRGEPLSLTAGEQVRDYAYVGDVASAIAETVLAGEFPNGEVFNLGSGLGVPLRTFVEIAARVFGGESWMRLGERSYREDEMWHLVSNSSKWKDRYGRPVATTSLVDGMLKVWRAGLAKETR